MSRAVRGLSLGVVAWALAVTAARAVRAPNDFAEAHWLLDYRFGFIRRGLAGAVLRAFGGTADTIRSEAIIRAVSYGIFGLVCAALLLVSYRIVSRSGWNRHIVLLVAAVVTSPFVVTLAHLMGYLDHLVLLLAVGAIWLTLRGYPWYGAALASVGILVHESALVVAVPPLVMASLVMRAAGRRPSGGRLGHLAWLVPVATFAAVAMIDAAMADQTALRKLLQLRLHRYPFVRGDMDVFVPEWLTTGLGDNAAAQWHHLINRLTDSSIVLAVMPALQATLFGTFAWMHRGARFLPGLALVVVACAPLALHVSAWDTARLWSLTIGCGLLGWWIVAETTTFEAAPLLALTPVVALPVLLDNIVGRIPLLDGVTERFTTATALGLYAPAAAVFALFWFLDARRPPR